MGILTTDQAGDLGELLAAADLSRPVRGRYNRPLFKPSFLGGKYPAVDYLIDILAPDNLSCGFFLVQVKSTERAKVGAQRLPINVETDKYNRIATLPAPAYLIGVDLNSERAYLVAAHRRRPSNVSSITKQFPLHSEKIKIDLYKEVVSFWKLNAPRLQTTRFKDDGK